jgi:anti-sigma factor RsiW
MSELPDLHKAMAESLPVYEAPASLKAWAREEARKTDGEASRHDGSATTPSRAGVRRFYQWRVAAGLVLAAVVGWGAASLSPVGGIRSTASGTTNELVDAHVRSLLPDHLLDVVSTDRHTVKPWFAGKTDIAPPVLDLTDKGFPLLGGRLDYVDGHSAAVLVYGRRLHKINVFVWRTTTSEPRDGSFEVRGHSLLHWSNGGLSYWAVSDAALADLEAFRDAYMHE